VVVESFRPGSIGRLGFSYEDTVKLNPSIVYCSVSGFGQTGPNALRPTVDGLIQAYSGLMMMNKAKQDKPARIPMIVIDIVTGLFVHQAISNALIGKIRFNEGARLDVSLMQTAAAMQGSKIIEHVHSGGTPPPLYAPSGTFDTADGHIVVTGMKASQFNALCQAAGRDDLARDPRWPTQSARNVHADIINGELAREFVKRSSDDWVLALHAVDVLAEKVQTYDEWLTDAHALATGAFKWLETKSFGRVPLVRNPCYDIEAADFTDVSPHAGQHSREILAAAGCTADEIDRFLSAGVVKAA